MNKILVPGFPDKIIAVARSCVSNDILRKFKQMQPKYVSVELCDTDGCNSSQSLKSSASVMVLIITIKFLFYRFHWKLWILNKNFHKNESIATYLFMDCENYWINVLYIFVVRCPCIVWSYYFLIFLKILFGMIFKNKLYIIVKISYHLSSFLYLMTNEFFFEIQIIDLCSPSITRLILIKTLNEYNWALNCC